MAGVIDQINERQASGDVPLNLLATSLVTHAFLLNPADKATHKAWVLEYLQRWEAHTAANGGILPDNVGPNAIVGELMDGVSTHAIILGPIKRRNGLDQSSAGMPF